MEPDESRAAALLHGAGATLLPLGLLHQRLRAAGDVEPGTPAQLRDHLRRRPDLFLVLERPSPLVGTDDWPEAERARYAAAVREAGIGGGTLVAALGSPAGPDAIAATETAPADETGGWAEAGEARTALGQALAELAAADAPELETAMAEVALGASELLETLGRLPAS